MKITNLRVTVFYLPVSPKMDNTYERTQLLHRGKNHFLPYLSYIYIYSFVFFTEEKAVTLNLFPAGLAVCSAPFRREISYPFI